MKFRVLVFLVIFLVLSSVVYGVNDLSKSKELIVDTQIISPVKILKTGGALVLTYLHVNYSWLPVEDYRQEVLFLSSNPKVDLTGDSLFFDIKTPEDFDIKVNFRTKTSSEPIIIKEKIYFPLKDLNSSLLEYTKPSELIDINEDIRLLSSSIAGTEDDLYVVVFKLADWVNTNIEYSLSSTTSEASLKSSWVLNERKGVCDELSNLFVSMVRSLGIPARVVSGISYTDSELFDYNWGPHGWTEVYFPGYGWVPFDPTYNQLGYVDASHIKMNEAAGEDRYSTNFEWKGKGFSVEPHTQIIDSEVVIQGSPREQNVHIAVEVFKQNIDFGSYNVIVATVINKKDYYVTKVLDISRTEKLEILDETRKDVLLKPKEVKKLYWIVKLDESFSNGFIYTFPITVFTQAGEKGESFFKTSQNSEFVSLELAKSIVDTQKTNLENSGMVCSADKDAVYLGEKTEISCKLSEITTSNTKLCVDEYCEPVKILNGVAKITVDFQDEGYRTLLVKSRDGLKEQRAFVSINVLDQANIKINNLTIPSIIKMEDSPSLEFVLEKFSNSIPKNVVVVVEHDLFSTKWELEELIFSQGFKLNINPRDLKSKDNEFVINVFFEDVKGEKFKTTSSISTQIGEVSFIDKLLLWLNDLQASLS